MTEAPKYPLPLGHVFGLNRLAVHFHDGRGKLDGVWLRQWQNRFCAAWRRPWMHPSGVFDGDTQKAVVEVQKHVGLPVTGALGPREWAAVWTTAPPEPKPKPAPQPKRKLSHKEKRKRRAYWDRFSRWQVEPGSDPDAPEWFPGRPFGPHSKGEYVKEVQHLLGFKETGRYSIAMGKRVAGLQRVHELPESGLVDARTAQLVESLRK
jgi:peptidoglycan hydrolase-like protein with peptidoglycan-binding domain